MKKILSLFCIAVGLACCSAATAQDIYVRINGINGTSTASGFTAYSEAVQTGLANTNCAVSGSTNATCASVPGNFNFQMSLTEVIPQLQGRLFQNTVISTVDFVFTKSNGTGTPVVYYQVHLEGVRVASIAEVATQGDRPSEQISLAFQKIAWKYTAQAANGSPVITYGCYNSTGAGGTGTGSTCSTYTFPF